MAKKPANSIKHTNFGRMDVDPAIADKLDHVAKVEEALKINKGFRKERTDDKRKRLANGAEARKQFGHKPKKRLNEDEFIHTLRNVERDLQRAEKPFDDVKRDLMPSNHNRRDQGYSGWSKEWNIEAHTGVVGKPPKRRDRTDPLYSKYPFAPKE